MTRVPGGDFAGESVAMTSIREGGLQEPIGLYWRAISQTTRGARPMTQTQRHFLALLGGLCLSIISGLLLGYWAYPWQSPP